MEDGTGSDVNSRTGEGRSFLSRCISDAFKGFVWTAPALMPLALGEIFPELGVLGFLLAMPGAPVVAFLSAIFLFGGSKSAWQAFVRGLAGLSLYSCALLVLSVYLSYAGKHSPEGSFIPALIAYMAVPALVAGGAGALARYLLGHVFRAVDRFFSS